MLVGLTSPNGAQNPAPPEDVVPPLELELELDDELLDVDPPLELEELLDVEPPLELEELLLDDELPELELELEPPLDEELLDPPPGPILMIFAVVAFSVTLV